MLIYVCCLVKLSYLYTVTRTLVRISYLLWPYAIIIQVTMFQVLLSGLYFFSPTVALSSYDFLSKLGVILTFFLSLHITKPHPYLFPFIAYVTLLSHSRTWLPNSKFQTAFVMRQLCTRTCVAQGHTPEEYEGCGLHRTTYLGNIKDMDCIGLHTRTLWRT